MPTPTIATTVTIHTIADTKSLATTEDTYYVQHDGETITMMVADGAPQRLATTGSLQPMLAEYGTGTAPGRYAALLTRDTAIECIAKAADVAEIALEANRRLRVKLEAIYGTITTEAVLKKEPTLTVLEEDPRFVRWILPVCCLTVARIDLRRRELTFAHGGDTALFLLYKDGRTVQITPDQMRQHDDKMRVEIKHILDEHPITSFADLQPHIPRYKRVDRFNGIYHNYEDEAGHTDTTVGVGVINGLPQLEAYLVQDTVSIDDLDGIILSSDGFFWPASMDETERQAEERRNQMGRVIQEQGLAHYVQALREEEATDLDGKRFQGFGRPDDATAIYVNGLGLNPIVEDGN